MSSQELLGISIFYSLFLFYVCQKNRQNLWENKLIFSGKKGRRRPCIGVPLRIPHNRPVVKFCSYSLSIYRFIWLESTSSARASTLLHSCGIFRAFFSVLTLLLSKPTTQIWFILYKWVVKNAFWTWSDTSSALW